MRGIGLFRASRPKGQKDDDDDTAITHERVSSRQNARELIEEKANLLYAHYVVIQALINFKEPPRRARSTHLWRVHLSCYSKFAY